MNQYKPKQGDIIFLDFNPQSGHEQAGRRPAIVVSNNDFNEFTGHGAIVCPITNTDRNWPVHVRLPECTKTTGVIMCDQVKSLDLKARNAEFYEEAPNEVIYDVLSKLKLFF